MTKTRIKYAVGFVFFVLLFVWAWCFVSFRPISCEFFPTSPFEFYELTDAARGGFSTASMDLSDSLLSVEVNVRSGVAYPAVGVGFNLKSVHNRPVDHFDFSVYDTLEIVFATRRMSSVSIRILTDDPAYSKVGLRETFRPVVYNVPASRSFDTVKVPVNGFKTAVWWLAAMGLEEDDGLTHLHRSTALEIANGDGILRGISDEISVKSLRAWGVSRDFENVMYAILIVMVVTFVILETVTLKRNPNEPPKNGGQNV
ncbi:MAG: hypothetical protein IK012_08865 [Fibrobacter sp.]|uniref:hypothetical protein n=1 Tax=Fibrobacter sp. TaxID=35828 RepID=UPI0025C723DC|nr:hypothetical protein [Fibrobacter sp.]MBR4785345.1 hypothetical protein [Fibrobacter sp.]